MKGKALDSRDANHKNAASPRSKEIVGNKGKFQDKKSLGKDKKQQMPSSKSVDKIDVKVGKNN